VEKMSKVLDMMNSETAASGVLNELKNEFERGLFITLNGLFAVKGKTCLVNLTLYR